MNNASSTARTDQQSISPTSDCTFSAARLDRLPAVTSQPAWDGEDITIQPPHWLTQLGLEQPRCNVRCLPNSTRIAKRALDIVVASSLLVLTAPLLLIAAVAVKLTSPGPILFSQIRVGLNARSRGEDSSERPQSCRRREQNYGKPFRIYKLRTMHVQSAGPTQAQQNDRRVTSVGKFLRKMRIDELPQLVNVLRGEMSMVGPRPECIEYIEELDRKIPNYVERLGLKPGLTGIAQIESGYANSLESYRRKVGYDLLYLQNCCIRNDLKIMLRTVRIVLTGFGAL